MSRRIRTLVRVDGMVQGVGFRPFVYSLATSLGLSGLVGNDAIGVFAEIEGPPGAVAEFLVALRRDAPPLASIEQVTTAPLPPDGGTAFTIAASDRGGERRALVGADTATCAECLAELADPADRRFGYPFINCTNCGPRFTIVRGVPYDRPLTTMAGFAMCPPCAAEYHDPASRRFHAQPTCCPDCGPALRLTDRTGAVLPVNPIEGAARAIARGQVVAVKGIGGYHLAADATSEAAAAALRARKHREDKPFAIMVADLDQARRLCAVDDAAAALLADRRRPIVLLPRTRGGAIAGPVAPGNRELGLMLPYSPLHHLLLAAVARPLILTSGNVSDEPIAHEDDDALARLAEIADAFLAHDRPIHVRADDSVARPAKDGRATPGGPGGPGGPRPGIMIRRARGYAPEPLAIPVAARRQVLACGAELKNTFCLAKGSRAFVSQHIGDLTDATVLRSFLDGIEHWRRLFDVVPAVVAHDLHPEYLSTKHAIDLADSAGLDLAGVQHHHAHIASCLADNGVAAPADLAGQAGAVIGVALDGTGWGPDGTVWGGELLIASLTGYQRAGHLATVPMPGGGAAVRQPWRMAAAYLDATGGSAPELRRRHEDRWAAVTSMARRGVNSPLTSSAGRLFDAVAALLGVRDEVTYEGQAAIELEQLADPAERGAYPVRTGTAPAETGTAPAETGTAPAETGTTPAETGTTPARTGTAPPRIGTGGVLELAGTELFAAAADELAAGIARPLIAARFHNGLAAVIAAACAELRQRTGIAIVALSGGVFQNQLLSRALTGLLEADGFAVLTHSLVPCNDGGISLGQAAVAAARDSFRGSSDDRGGLSGAGPA